MPRAVRLEDGRLVANPGSVGLQAYNWDQPREHTMATGSPRARYAIFEGLADGWAAEMMTVDYDWAAAAEISAARGAPDWPEALRTGRLRAMPGERRERPEPGEGEPGAP
ncbi:hypothetical protein [Sorangium sp. So ce406]|uniref:hypothetical protein n=1 Tax=Sorangium sp. So ce406 TaxID=3133311 RepID=UPI003F5B4D91